MGESAQSTFGALLVAIVQHAVATNSSPSTSSLQISPPSSLSTQLRLLLPRLPKFLPLVPSIDTHGSTSEMGEPLRRTRPRPGVTWATAVAVCLCEQDVREWKGANVSRDRGIVYTRMDEHKSDRSSRSRGGLSARISRATSKVRTFFLPKVWTADIFCIAISCATGRVEQRRKRGKEGWERAGEISQVERPEFGVWSRTGGGSSKGSVNAGTERGAVSSAEIKHERWRA